MTSKELEELLVHYNSAKKKLEFQLESTKQTIADLKKQVGGAAPKRRGRPAKAKTATAAKPKTAAKRGRTAKAKTTTAAKPKTAAKRGRPAKAKTTTAAKPKTAAKRGRPAKAKTTTAAKPKTAAKRGRPAKAKTTTAAKPKTAAKRGRPAKAKTATTAKKTVAKKPVAKKTAAKKTVAKKPAAKSASQGAGYKLSDWDQFIIDDLKKAKVVLTKNQLCEDAKKWSDSKKKGLSQDQVYTKVSNVLHKLTNKKSLVNRFSNDKIKNAYGLSDWFTASGNLKNSNLPK